MNLRRYSSQADGEVGGTKKDFLADWWVKREMKSQQNSSNNRRHLLITWSILLPDLVHQAPCTAEVSFDKEFQVTGRNLYNWGHITMTLSLPSRFLLNLIQNSSKLAQYIPSICETLFCMNIKLNIACPPPLYSLRETFDSAFCRFIHDR